MKDIDTFVAKIDKLTLMLSAEERERTTKMRARGERIVELVGTLAAFGNARTAALRSHDQPRPT